MCNPSERLNKTLMWLLLAIFLIGGSLWSWYTPSCIDDYTYNKVPLEYTHESFDRCDGRAIETYADAFDAIGHDMRVDNGRLANFVHILFQPLPKVVERLCNCLALMVMTILMCVLGGRGMLRPGSTILTLPGIWVLLPWYSGLQALVFQTNYVWSGALMCAALLLWYMRQRLKPVGFVLYCLLMVVLGWWHEGFAVGVLAFMFVDLLINSPKYRIRSLVLFISCLSGLILNIVFGTWVRLTTHGDINSNVGNFSELAFGIAMDIWPAFLAVALLAVVVWRRKEKRREIVRRIAPWLATMLIFAAVPFVLQMYERTFWPMLMIAILINVWMLSELIHVRPAMMTLLMIASIGLSGWWFVELIRYERKVRVAYDGFVAQLVENKDGGTESNVVYGAMGGLDAVPWYLFDIPNSFEENFEATRYLARNFGFQESVIVMLPDSLGGLSYDELPEIEGNTGFKGAWPTLLTKDTNDHGALLLTLAPSQWQQSPAGWLMSKIKKDDTETTYPLKAWRFAVTMPDGEEVYAYYVIKRPMSKRYRPMMRLDFEY